MRSFVTVALLSLAASPAAAQDDRSAGLFTEARQLPLVSQAIAVSIAGGEAELIITQVFANDGEDVGQADYHLHVPEGAAVTGFGFWQDDRFLSSSLKAKDAAEAAHDRAAGEGRTTAIVKNERSMHHFSVYPVRAGELKQVQTTLRVPVVMETGRSHLAIPVDRFLGQPGVSSTMTVRLESDADIEAWGAEGAAPITLRSEPRRVAAALAADRPIDFWWRESSEALDTRAEAVALEDGTVLQVRVVLADASPWVPRARDVAVIVDGSFSMRRRAAAVAAAASRIHERALGRVSVIAAGDVSVEALAGDPAAAARRALDGRTGHTTSVAAFARAMELARCSAEVRCVAITDLARADFEAFAKLELEALFLADAHELAFTETRRPANARVHQPGTDAPAHLEAIADELVLPVVSLVSVAQGGEALDLPGAQPRRVAEGGMLRLFARARSAAPIELVMAIGGREVERSITAAPLLAGSEAGLRVRQGWFRAELARMMAAYRTSPDEALKAQIIAISVRESIPTAFTALQVDDPALSLYAIKPGDPLLTVYDEAGLERVIAHYPFGEARSLVFDTDTRLYTDRFLVPRGWAERGYRVDVYKHFADGSVKVEHTWYRIDERGPSATISFDDKRRIIRVDTGEETPEVASVTVQGKGKTIALSPVGTEWLAFADELPRQFTLFIRDRAGNRTAFACSLAGGRFEVLPEVRQVVRAPSLPRVTPMLVRHVERGAPAPAGTPIAVEGRSASIAVAGREVRFSLESAPIRGLLATAVLQVSPELILFGTEGGELVELRARGASQDHEARLLSTPEVEHHAIRGLAAIGEGRVLAGVLGRGLFELSAGKLKRSRIQVGSKFITAVVETKDEILIGTAYNGLWRLRGNRAVKTLFPADDVRAVSVAGGVWIESGRGTYRQTGRDRFVAVRGAKAPPQGSAMFTAAVELGGTVYAAGFDRGLFRLGDDGVEPVALRLSPIERQVNALAVFGGHLYLGTEGGLFVWDPSAGTPPQRVLEGSVHDLAPSQHGVAAATSRGLWVIAGQARRIDRQGHPSTGKFFSVAWHQGALYAGDMEGLYRFSSDCGEVRAVQIGAAEGFDASWVTALVSAGDRLYAGTYDAGVFAVKDVEAARVRGLETQWVPPHGMRAIDGEVWIGGLGMRPARIDRTGRITALDVPARDTNDFLRRGDDTLVVTSDGLLEVRAERSASTTSPKLRPGRDGNRARD